MNSSAGATQPSDCFCLSNYIGVSGGPCYSNREHACGSSSNGGSASLLHDSFCARLHLLPAEACERGFAASCAWPTICHNTVVGPVCGAFVPSGRVRLVKGARITSTDSHVLLNTTQGQRRRLSLAVLALGPLFPV